MIRLITNHKMSGSDTNDLKTQKKETGHNEVYCLGYDDITKTEAEICPERWDLARWNLNRQNLWTLNELIRKKVRFTKLSIMLRMNLYDVVQTGR